MVGFVFFGAKMNIVIDNELRVQDGLCLVKFWATWCGPCKKLEPLFETLKNEFSEICFVSVDVEQESSLAQRYKVRTLPTLLLLKDGQEVSRISGLTGIDSIRKLLRESLV